MARYSINGQILTDMADAIRAKKGEVQPEIISGISTYETKTEFKVEKGKKYKITFTVTGVVSEAGDGFWPKIVYKSYSTTYNIAQLTSTAINLVEGQTESFIFESTESRNNAYLTFGVVWYSDKCDATFTLEEVDADGNPLYSYAPEDMVEAINDMPPVPNAEDLTITGDASEMFGAAWGWFIEKYGPFITTKDLTNASYMFESTTAKRIPFALNFKKGATHNCTSMFASGSLEELPEVNDFKPYSAEKLFYFAQYLRAIPDSYVNIDMTGVNNGSSYVSSASNFTNCYSLRYIPKDFLKKLKNDNINSSTYSPYYSMCNACYVLDEIRGIPVIKNKAVTSNIFSSTFLNTSRAKSIVFDVDEDTNSPWAVNWKGQTVDLSTYVGYSSRVTYVLNFNSGITADKEVKDDATYQALKDDPDWFTLDVAYSRYNHDSAVETINSLPDCTASGGTNTIKFKGASGSATDGGAINTLTEEEIAVAAAKGWTVSLV